ncbi:MAG TPA: T9SS type A sorting domain-containing protein, partial [Agriterribacter sp.]|nr:T9SS type A sorting domain-containing protein [Agriterribacter sp.]
YTISPLQPSDIGKYYRVIVAAAGNINNANCRYTSTAFQLTAKTSSTAPTGIDASPAQTTCPGNAVNLTVQGGSLGTNAVWRWYRNSCGDTLIGTGNMISVLPTETTTYYVRAEGDCNITDCAQVTINLIPCVILPVDFLQFSAVQRAYSIDLDWRIITSEQISHFEVERSEDGSHFKKIGAVSGSSVPKNTAVKFSYQDADTDINSHVIYYRIKVISKDGVSKYSNILTVRVTSVNTGKLKISPNPASSLVNISFYSTLRGTMELQLLDMTGKVVLREQRTVEAGQNSITLNQLSHLSEGIYTILVRTNDKWERERIVIKR